LALAPCLSGLLAIALTVLTFLVERTVRRYRARDRPYQRNLVLIILASAAAILLAVLALSTWLKAAPRGIELVFGWDSRTWLTLIFGLAIAAAGAGMAAAITALTKFRRTARGGARWEP
jgi:hypothetical protein